MAAFNNTQNLRAGPTKSKGRCMGYSFYKAADVDTMWSILGKSAVFSPLGWPRGGEKCTFFENSATGGTEKVVKKEGTFFGHFLAILGILG